MLQAMPLVLSACTGLQHTSQTRGVPDHIDGVHRMAFRDPERPVDERIADLIARLTLAEKASLLLHDSAAIDRLDIPAYNWWESGL